MTELRVGLVGAGYIAAWHADALRATPGVRLAAACDADAGAARRFGAARGVPAFASVPEMLAAGRLDAAHVLTPPPSHAPLARALLEAGLHVLVEKPLALSSAQVEELGEVAARVGRALGACHNFLGLPSMDRLRRLLARGGLGRLIDLRVEWALPLAPLQSGPYGLWFLREPANLLWELGPHPFAFVQDLLGPWEVRHVELGQWAEVPGAGQRAQSWRVLGRAGPVDVTIALSLPQTFEERALTLRGSSGTARLDYGADALTVARDNGSDLVLNGLRREWGRAAEHGREGAANVLRQALSLNRRSPYALGFQGTFRAFYDGARAGAPDPRLGPAAAAGVARAIEAAVALMPAPPARPPAPALPPATGATVAVVGGTGYIGRALARTLAARGHRVRVLSRGARSPFPDLAPSVQVVAASLGDEAALAAALQGADAVVNLARAQEASFEAALEGDVAANERVLRAALAAGVRRFVHAGTIASFDMSQPGTVTEDTPFGPGEGRNAYARAKAEGEARLAALAAAAGLSFAIVRPGIVVGDDGPLQHWGIGRWHGAGAVRLWNGGTNLLPFVLVDDVAEGIALAALSDAPGAFNLVGEPLLSARGYFDAMATRLGARVRVTGGSPLLFWAAEGVKAALKRRVLRRPSERASLADWRSRGHVATLSNARAKAVLGWRPEADREAFLRRALDEAGLFGL